jgi:CRP-like cAMP-binding protein
LKADGYFGEIALIDDGPRMATITAASELVCYGLTFWDFRPLVVANGVIGWKCSPALWRSWLRDVRSK